MISGAFKDLQFENNLNFAHIHLSFCTLYTNILCSIRQHSGHNNQIKNAATQHRMNQLALVNHNGNMDNEMSHPMAPPAGGYDPKVTPMSIATISSGFEKGDFLVREEKGQRVVS